MADQAAKDPSARRMRPAELQQTVARLVEDAEQFIDEELSQRRADAIKAYRGEPFGEESPGRSSFVLSVVRDNVAAVLPALLRIFASNDRVVEYEARTPAGEAQARQATALINKIVLEDNAGFLAMHSVLWDGLLKKVGAWMWGFSKDTLSRVERYSELTDQQLDLLLADPEADVVEGSLVSEPALAPGPDGQPMPLVLHRIEVRRTVRAGSVWLKALPPEEFLIDRDARSLEEATLVGYRTTKTRGELLDLGVPAKFIDEHGGDGGDLDENEERIARENAANRGMDRSPEAGPAGVRHKFVEAYVRVDADGDGIPELRRICLLGPGLMPIPGMDEPVECRPFAMWCPDPQPHTWLGDSLADRLMDLQKTESKLLRTIFDSASLSVFPRLAMLDGQVNVQDVLNTEIGAPIRERTPGAVRPLNVDFVGGQLLPLLEFTQSLEERRTGRNRGAAGLSAEALQSTTPDAAMAAIQGGEQQTELFARLFAEQCLKPTFRGLLKLVTDHLTEPVHLKLQGQWEQLDPASWDPYMDVYVRVALSDGRRREQAAALGAIAAKQWEVLTAYGMDNPLVGLPEHYQALARLISLENLGPATQFFRELPPDWAPPPPEPPPPTPEQELAQAQVEVERIRSERTYQIEMKKLELEALKLELQLREQDRRFELDTMRVSGDQELKREQIVAKEGAALSAAQLNAEVARDRADLDAAVRLAALTPPTPDV
jgi:hypothetical protein